MKARNLKALVGLSALVLTATMQTGYAASKPAPFNAGAVKIALVQNSGAGDYFQQWTNGA